LSRTYKSATVSDVDCTIWQAGRATTAAPNVFKPIAIGSDAYVDGHRQNPICSVISEAQNVFPGRHIACVISIGSGI
ncbi:hypothetical protein B0H11DRAFT_1626574, partial [Mycena galericulata]